jgi:tetratricopeptide (TPR) repeat protein
MPMPMVNKYANAYKQALADSPDNQDLNNSIAMCYLKLKLYDKALAAFERAMEDNFDNSETFFYAAICLLKGQKAFLAQRAAIDKIEEYINAALMIEPKGVYYYFWAYIKYDYFSRKSYKTSPTYQEALAMATSAGESVSQFDCQQLYAILNVACPDPVAIF